MTQNSHVTTDSVGPTTVEGYLADRQHFWLRFTRFIMGAVVVVAVVLILLAWLT